MLATVGRLVAYWPLTPEKRSSIWSWRIRCSDGTICWIKLKIKDGVKTKVTEEKTLVNHMNRSGEGARFVPQDHKGITVERRSAHFARRRGRCETFLVIFEVRRRVGKAL